MCVGGMVVAQERLRKKNSCNEIAVYELLVVAMVGLMVVVVAGGGGCLSVRCFLCV